MQLKHIISLNFISIYYIPYLFRSILIQLLYLAAIMSIISIKTYYLFIKPLILYQIVIRIISYQKYDIVTNDNKKIYVGHPPKSNGSSSDMLSLRRHLAKLAAMASAQRIRTAASMCRAASLNSSPGHVL